MVTKSPSALFGTAKRWINNTGSVSPGVAAYDTNRPVSVTGLKRSPSHSFSLTKRF